MSIGTIHDSDNSNRCVVYSEKDPYTVNMTKSQHSVFLFWISPVIIHYQNVQAHVHKWPPLVHVISNINLANTLPSFTSLRSTSISSTHLHLDITSGLFPSGFPTQTISVFNCLTYVLHVMWQHQTRFRFVSMFAKVWKVSITFIMSVCPSTWNNSAPSGQVFMKFDLRIPKKSIEEYQGLLKSEKNYGIFRWKPVLMLW